MDNPNVLVLMPSYQVAKWITLGINMLKLQSYQNWRCVIIDDHSTDNSYGIIEQQTYDDDRFEIRRNTKNNGSSLANYIKGFDIANPKDEDIVVWVDGDDWLAHNFVLEDLVKIYQKNDVWMTYGSWKVYPTGEEFPARYTDIPDWVHKQNAYRQWTYVYSHLRTHKAFLFRNLNRQDLWDDNSQRYYSEGNDTAYLFPLVEMSGPEHIYRNEEISLILNRENPLNDAKINLEKQKQTEWIIRNKQPYSRLVRR